ncbi:MAG: hypothetical protein QM765_06060 [Myxococcales bacterium]
MPDDPKSDLSGKVISAGFGLVLLLIAVLLTYGAFFEPRRPGDTFDLPAQGYLLLASVYALTLSLLVSVVNRPAVQRIQSALSTVALLSFAGFFVWLAVLAAVAPPRETRPGLGHYTFAVLVFFAAGSGTFLGFVALLQHRRAAKVSAPPPALSPGSMLIWPLLALFKAPLGSAVVFGLCAGLTFFGEWLGGRFGHPLAGAVAFLVVPMVVGVLAAGRSAARQIRGG